MLFSGSHFFSFLLFKTSYTEYNWMISVWHVFQLDNFLAWHTILKTQCSWQDAQNSARCNATAEDFCLNAYDCFLMAGAFNRGCSWRCNFFICIYFLFSLILFNQNAIPRSFSENNRRYFSFVTLITFTQLSVISATQNKYNMARSKCWDHL